jgi:signal transduction histidine kinase
MENDNFDFSSVSWLRRYGIMVVIWSVLVGGSLLWAVHQESRDTLSAAAAAARANISKDLIFRRWAASHGGVYVSPTEHTPPNPYLKLSDRDVVTTTGKKLTLMNPAYMLRELQTDFVDDYGTRSHITSLKLLNPKNAPDDWETGALRAFEQGEKERLEVQQIDGQPFLRMMRPLSIETGCLKCHAFQGYKVGDTRGGLSTAVSLTSYLARERERSINLALTHSTIWLIGLLGLGVSYRRDSNLDAERKRAEDGLRKSRDELESKVLERTWDLRSANTALLAEKMQQEELIRKLAEAHSQLLQSEKMASLGQLAAGVAHEINNPIGFVNSNLGTLKHYIADLFVALSAYEESEWEMTSETREVLAELKRKIDIVYLREDVGNLLSESMDGLQRVKRIVQDLKDFSHVGEEEKQWASLEQGLDSTLNVIWNELKYKAEVVKEYAGIPKIECIPSQLNQVFMNLLMNAGQAIEDHGRITIRTGQEDEHVWVEVEDTGKGIKPEHMAHIFDPFFTTKPVGTGTGLGLSLSYGIVQKHGGRIEVRSEPGKGSVFRVVLPHRHQ